MMHISSGISILYPLINYKKRYKMWTPLTKFLGPRMLHESRKSSTGFLTKWGHNKACSATKTSQNVKTLHFCTFEMANIKGT